MNPTEILQKRGIEEAARGAGWQDAPNPYDNRTPGWTYPLFTLDGDVWPDLTRWKAALSANQPKYVWWPKGVKDRPVFYTLPWLQGAIEDAGGELHMVSGEPDLLTMNTVGITNVTCAFGERNISNLDRHLKVLGVKRLIYWRDRDQTGLEAAIKARDSLEGTGIAFECRMLNGVVADKYDLNKLWMDCRFDAAVFFEALGASYIEVLPEPEQPPLPSKARSSEPKPDTRQQYESWCSDVEDAAVRAWGLQDADGQGFSRNMINCPFHQDKTGSAHWNYRTHGLRCFGACGREYNTQEVAEHLGMESWEDYKARQRPVRTPAPRNGRKREPVRLISRDEAVQEAEDRLFGRKMPEVEPYLAPYRPLRQFGGLAKMWEPGQVGLIISGAGMGKSAFVERIIDNLNVAGMDAVMWGPEWSPERYQSRAVARYGGPIVERQLEHEAHEFERFRQVEEFMTMPLSKEELKQAQTIFDLIRTWPGKTHYVPPSITNLTKALAIAGQAVDDLRAAGRRLRLAVFDYAQLAIGPKADWTALEMMLAAVQEWSILHKIFSLVVSQVNKGESERLRKYGTLFTADSAQLLSDQRTKLIVTLNPVYLDGGRHEKAWIHVVKNNLGAFPARILVKTALWRNDWTDEVLEGLTSKPMGNQASQPMIDQEDEEPFEFDPSFFNFSNPDP